MFSDKMKAKFSNDRIWDYSCKQPTCNLCVVPNGHELAYKLREDGLNPFSGLCKRYEGRFPVLSVKPVGTFEPDVHRFKEV